MCVRSSVLTALVSLLAAGVGPAWAQASGTVEGIVRYDRNGEGVPGVRLVLDPFEGEVLTDDAGRYRIEGTPLGRWDLRLELLGCELASREIDVRSGSPVTANFELGAAVIGLDGLVVTGVRSLIPRDGLGTSSDALDPDWTGSTATSLSTLLQGRLAGVRVMRGSGLPGSESTILLRGPTSIQGSQAPLVVVDGMIASISLSEIDSRDVESLEVLKGASAASIYGSRGQAGVIEIRTKRGTRNAARPLEPMVVIDGVPDDRSFTEIDPLSIEEIHVLRGAAGAVFYGPRAEAGAFRITTKEWAASNATTPAMPSCLVPGGR